MGDLVPVAGKDWKTWEMLGVSGKSRLSKKAAARSGGAPSRFESLRFRNNRGLIWFCR